MNYDVFSYFNGDQIQGVLNAVVMLVGSGGVDGDYLSLIRIAGVFGLFIAVTAGFVRARGEDAGAYVIMMALFYSVLFMPRATVTINEVGLGAGGVRTVANVPIGLAFFASTTSHIGYWLTLKTETFFSLPDADLNFGKHGLMGASRALREASSAAVQDPVLQQDMINFMRDCVNPEIANSPAMVAALMNSTALWQDITVNLGILNPGRMVTLIGYPTAVPCTQGSGGHDGVTIINSVLPQEVTGQLNRIAALLTPAETPANAQAILAAMLPASESLIITASETAADAIKQRMMINLMNNTSASMAQITNDPVASQNALATAMAAQSANSSYQVMASLAAETLPLIRNAIELVIIGIFPIVLVLIVIAGTKGGIVLRSYVMTMLWVQLWAPLYAIVNYVGTLSSAKSMTAALAGINGVAINNAAQFVSTTISGQAVVGMLTISVPIIALAIVKGGEAAMSGVVAGLLGPAQQAGTRVGGPVGLGNISAGLVGWGNYSANNQSSHHTDNAPSYRTSSLYTLQDEKGTVVTDTASAKTVDVTPTFGGGGSVQFTAGTALSNATSSGRSVSGEAVNSATLSEGTSSVFSREGLASFARSDGASINRRFGTDINFSEIVGAGESVQASSNASVSRGRGDQETWQGTLGGGANLGIGGAVSIGESAAVAPASGTPTTAASASSGVSGTGPIVQQGAVAGANVPPLQVQPAAAGSTAHRPGSAVSARGGLGFEAGAKTIQAQSGEERTQHAQESSNTASRENMARRVESAIDSYIGGTHSAREQQAARAFKNAFQRRVATETSSGYQSHEGVMASSEQRETASTGVQATLSSGAAVFQGLVAYYGGDQEKARNAYVDPANDLAARQAVSEWLAASPEARRQLEAGWLRKPASAGSVTQEAAAGVSSAASTGQGAVAEQGRGDAAAVRARQFADPQSDIQSAPAQSRASALQEEVMEHLSSAGERAAFKNGSARVADYINQDVLNRGNASSFFRMLDDRGGIPRAEQTQVLVGALAASSPTIREAIVHAGETGAIPNSMKPYIASQAEKLWETQLKPGELSPLARYLGAGRH